MDDIRKKYEKLRRAYEQMKAQRDIAAAEEAERIGIPDSEIEVYVNDTEEELAAYLTEPANESLTEEAAEVDDSVHPLNPERDLYFARQQESA
jgi:hypothetical protein